MIKVPALDKGLILWSAARWGPWPEAARAPITLPNESTTPRISLSVKQQVSLNKPVVLKWKVPTPQTKQ